MRDRWYASGNIGKWKQGSIVPRLQIAAYFRTVLNEGALEEITLSDDDILKVVDEMSGDKPVDNIQQAEDLELEIITAVERKTAA